MVSDSENNGLCNKSMLSPPFDQRSCCLKNAEIVIGALPLAKILFTKIVFQPASCNKNDVQISSECPTCAMPPMPSTAARRNNTLVPTQNAEFEIFFAGQI